MTDAKSAADPSTTTARPERAYTDADGVRWRVYEQPFAEYDRRSGTSLIFASDGAVRRVRNFPSSWIDMPEADLAGLSWQS